MQRTYSLAILIVMLAGMICWAALFTLLYGGVSLVCTPPLSAGAMLTFRIGAFAVSLLLLMALGGGALLLWRRAGIELRSGTRNLRTFLAASTMALAVGGFIASTWLIVPVLMLGDCRS